MHGISVVIPCFNRGSLIADTLASVAAQTLAPLEIIVVDDCSADDSIAVASRFDVQVLALPVNGGAAAARNAGLQIARGDLVAFCDADDLWAPSHLAELRRLAEAIPDAGVFFTGARTSRGEAMPHTLQHPLERPLDLLVDLFSGLPICQSAAAARRDVLRAVGGYDPTLRMAEDYDLWLRLAPHVRFACSHEVTVTYRLHDAQTSRRSRDLMLGAWQARLRAWHRLRATGTAPEVSRAAEALARILTRDLRDTWYWKDAELFDRLLALAPGVPGAADEARRWHVRRRWFWTASGWAQRLARGLPEPLRIALRRTRPRSV